MSKAIRELHGHLKRRFQEQKTNSLPIHHFIEEHSKADRLSANTHLGLNRSIQEQNTNSLTANSGLPSHHLIEEHGKDDSLSANTDLGLNRSTQEQNTNSLTANSGLPSHHLIEERGKDDSLSANTDLGLNRSTQEQNTNDLTTSSGLPIHHSIEEHSKNDRLSANTDLDLNRSIQEQNTNDLTTSSGLPIHHFIDVHSKDDRLSANIDLGLNRSIQEQNTNNLTANSGFPIHHFSEEHSKDDRLSANTDLGLNRSIQEQNTNSLTANSGFPIHHYRKFGLNGNNIQEQSTNSSTENSVTNCLIAKSGGLELSPSVQGLNNTDNNVSDLNGHFQDLNMDHSMANNIQAPNGKVCLELFPQHSGLVSSISMAEVPKKGNFSGNRSATDPKTAQIKISCAEKVLEFDHFPVDSVEEVMLFVKKKAINSQNLSSLASTLENEKKVSTGSDLIPKCEHLAQPLDQANDSVKRFFSEPYQFLKRIRDVSPAIISNSNHVNQEAVGGQPPRNIIGTSAAGTQSIRTRGSNMGHPPIITQTKIIERGKGKVISPPRKKCKCNGDKSSQYQWKETTRKRVDKNMLLEIFEAIRSTSSVTRTSTPSVSDCIPVLNETLNFEKGGGSLHVRYSLIHEIRRIKGDLDGIGFT